MTSITGKYCVYIVLCQDGTYYTGYTNDLERRLKLHNSGKGAKYTRGRGPVRLVYKRGCNSLSKALKTEIEIKSLTREEKEKLVNTKKRSV